MPKIKRLKLSEFKQQAADAEFRKNSAGIFVPKQYAAEVKEVEGEDNTLDFKISTGTVDRDGDTIAADGWKLKNYKKNPVVLWAHDHGIPAIGRSKRIKVVDEALTSRNVYPSREDYEFGNLIFRLHKGGFLKAVSVGFIPLKYEVNEDRDSSGWGPPIDFVQQELLEHSSVNVPANPEALEIAGAKGIDMTPMLEWYESAIDRDLPIERAMLEIGWRHVRAACGKGATVSLSLPKSVVADAIAKVLGGHTGQVEIVDKVGLSPEARQKLADQACDEKTTTPFANLPTAPEDQRWNPRGTADSELINAVLGDPPDWKRYKKANVWWDGEGGEKLGAYKLKIARMFDADDPDNVAPEGGRLTAVWRQVASRMGILLGARGGVDIPDADRKAVYDHLVRYYKKWDKEPPEFKSYTEAELKALFPEKADGEADPPAGDPAPADPPAENPPTEPAPADDPAPEDPPAEDPPAEDPPADTAPAEETAFDELVTSAADAVREIVKAGRVLSGANEDLLRRSRDLLDEVLSQLAEQGGDGDDDEEDDDKTAALSEIKSSLNEDGEVVLDLTEEQFEAVKTAVLDRIQAEIRWATGALD